MVSDPIKILIVDDDEQVLIELERLLESEGYSTATAWSVREALDLSDKLQFDLLLVDEHLHGLDSTELLVELQLKQPGAFPLLMRSSKNQRLRAPVNAVCKWEHAEMKARIRQHLAA
jgi:DNA-binding response OmpR family regulator